MSDKMAYVKDRIHDFLIGERGFNLNWSTNYTISYIRGNKTFTVDIGKLEGSIIFELNNEYITGKRFTIHNGTHDIISDILISFIETCLNIITRLECRNYIRMPD